MPKLIVHNGFRRYRQDLDRMVTQSIDRTSKVILDELKARAPVGDGRSGVQPGHFRDTFRFVPAWPYRKGFRGGVATEDPTAVWLKWGTLGRRKKKLSGKTLARRASASGAARLSKVAGRGGVKPHAFFSRAARIGQDRMVDEMKRAAPR